MDDLALGTLLSLHATSKSPEDSFPQIEFVSEDELPSLDELAMTGRFVRWSAPYERIELDTEPASESESPASQHSRPSRFARTTTRTPPIPTSTIEVEGTPDPDNVETVRAPKVTIEAALAEFAKASTSSWPTSKPSTKAAANTIARAPTPTPTTAPTPAPITSTTPTPASMTPTTPTPASMTPTTPTPASMTPAPTSATSMTPAPTSTTPTTPAPTSTTPTTTAPTAVAATRVSRTSVEKLASTTMSLDQKWFAQADSADSNALAFAGGSFEDMPAIAPTWASWRWLAISMLAAALVVIAAQLAL